MASTLKNKLFNRPRGQSTSNVRNRSPPSPASRPKKDENSLAPSPQIHRVISNPLPDHGALTESPLTSNKPLETLDQEPSALLIVQTPAESDDGDEQLGSPTSLPGLNLALTSFGDTSPAYSNTPLPRSSSEQLVDPAWPGTVSTAIADRAKVRPWIQDTKPQTVLASASTKSKFAVQLPSIELDHTVSSEQTEYWDETRTKVTKALKSVIGTTVDVAHEMLETGADLLELAPVPGLAEAARVLLNIWDAVQMVDGNRLACLRLVSRCADILVSVREELRVSNDQVTEELVDPVKKLVDSFVGVKNFLIKQTQRPFLKRYLKRDEILTEIEECDKALRDSLSVFGVSIQIRILRNLKEAEKHRREDEQAMMNEILRSQVAMEGRHQQEMESLRGSLLMSGALDSPSQSSPVAIPGRSTRQEDITPRPGHHPLPSSSPSQLSTTPHSSSLPKIGQTIPPSSSNTTTTPTPSILTPPQPASESSILSPRTQLRELQSLQNVLDHTLDAADLRAILKATLALGATSDVNLIEVLGVGREEMPEAIKALQRALERAIDRQETGKAEAMGLGLTFDTTSTNINATEGGGLPGSAGSGVGLPPSLSSGSGSGSGTQNSRSSATEEGLGLGLKRRGTIDSSWSASGPSESDEWVNDRTLDREFMETGIDALRRMSDSRGVEVGLPSWSITRFEVSHTKKIGMGFFSEVYLGTLLNHQGPVAIKVLSPMTPREMFVKEVNIWKNLRHPNVLQLLGASAVASSSPTSSTFTGPTQGADGGAERPWFLVSPFMENGNVVTFLRSVKEGKRAGLPSPSPMSIGVTSSAPSTSPPATQPGPGQKGSLGKKDSTTLIRELKRKTPLRTIVEGEAREMEVDLLKMIYELAKGMEYLHSRGVVHGDLKGTNVLVNDRLRCVITDFGQSEMKNEASRISGAKPPHGTFRWKAPELMSGNVVDLTTEMDVYAFAICCVEILGMGRMPWGSLNDAVVKNAVDRGSRPEIPKTRYTIPAAEALINRCWHTNPFDRPSFSEIVGELKMIRKMIKTPPSAVNGEDGKSPHSRHASLEKNKSVRESPDIKPHPLPFQKPGAKGHHNPALGISPDSSHASDGGTSFETAPEGGPSTSFSSSFGDVHRHNHQHQHQHHHTGSLPGPDKQPHQRSQSTASGTRPEVQKPHRPHNGRRLSLIYRRPTIEETVGCSTSDEQKIHGKAIFMPSPTRSRASSESDSSVFEMSSSSDTDGVSDVEEENERRAYSDGGGGGLLLANIEGGGGPAGMSGSVLVGEPGEHRSVYHGNGFDGAQSPPPANSKIAQVKNERRYRLLLTHEYHPSLILPLWTPTPVKVGAVGYLSKPSGTFVTLFNSFTPLESSTGLMKELPSLYGYGKVTTGTQKLEKRNMAQNVMDAIAGLLTFSSSSRSVSRRFTYSLRAGHKAAYLYAETTTYQYVDSLEAPKKWFKANVDHILQNYGAQHKIQKEDLFLVIGTLNSPDYGLFVSHSHPDSQVHFNVFSGQPKGSQWGAFTLNTDLPSQIGGPSYHENGTETAQSASVISEIGGPWNTLLLARLRFKPDVLEPTSL